jgi:hypothetical protein
MPQPSTTGMVIPKIDDLSFTQLKEISSSLDGFEKMLSKEEKAKFKERKEQLERWELQSKYEKKLKEILEPPSGFKKIQLRLAKYTDKWLVKDNFLKKLGGFFKKLIDRSGGWLKTLLEILLFFAIFDPGGSFLNGIFNLITSMLEKAINFIIPKVPIIAKRMWKLFWDVVVPGFGKMGKAIGEAIFGKGIMADIFEWLGKAAPVLVVILGVLGKIIEFKGAIVLFGKILAAIATFLFNLLFPGVLLGIKMLIAAYSAGAISFGAMLAGIWAMVWPILAVVAAIAAVGIALYMLWKHWDKVKAWLFSVGAWFKKIGSFLAKIGSLVWKAIVKWFKKVGSKIAQFGKIVWKAIVNWFKSLSFTSIIKKALILALFGLPGLLVSALIKIGPTIINFVLRGLQKILPAGAFQKLLEIVNFIRGIFNTVSDYITAFFADPLSFLKPVGGQAGRDAAISAARLSRLGQSDEVSIKDLQVAGIGAADAAKIKEGKLSTSEIAEIISKSGDAEKAKKQTAELNTKVSHKWEKSFDSFKDKDKK